MVIKLNLIYVYSRNVLNYIWKFQKPKNKNNNNNLKKFKKIELKIWFKIEKNKWK